MIFPGVRLFPDVAPGEPLFGYSIRQPFASGIVDASKRLENRPKPPPARLQGRAFWIAIHAGAEFFRGVTREDFTTPREFAPSPCEMDMLDEEAEPAVWPACPPFAVLPRRAVIGAARVIGCARQSRFRLTFDRDPWAGDDEYRWLLDPTVIRLPVPFAWDKGELGLWSPKPDGTPNQDAKAARFLALRDALRAAMADPSNHRRAVAAWHPRT